MIETYVVCVVGMMKFLDIMQAFAVFLQSWYLLESAGDYGGTPNQPMASLFM